MMDPFLTIRHKSERGVDQISIRVPNVLSTGNNRADLEKWLKKKEAEAYKHLYLLVQNHGAHTSADDFIPWAEERSLRGKVRLKREDQVQMKRWFDLYDEDVRKAAEHYQDLRYQQEALKRLNAELRIHLLHGKLQSDIQSFLDISNGRNSIWAKKLLEEMNEKGMEPRTPSFHLTDPVSMLHRQMDDLKIGLPAIYYPNVFPGEGDQVHQIGFGAINKEQRSKIGRICELLHEYLHVKGYPVRLPEIRS
ncbi:MAG TPA: hypothetical protein VI874_00160 [Candidatus Norongarragalinales archaeon]|nr:hypothetical protein [Candidatus Norongarragalinales archaeon]